MPENVKLKKIKDFTIIGQEIVNVDIDKIITGKPLFGLDYKAEGMQFASVLRPPAFGQKLESFDDSKTKVVNGVTEVIKFGDKIAVLASSTWAAMKGKKALSAIWKDEDLESTEDHNKILTNILDGNDFNTRREDGNINEAFSVADKLIERTYHSPFLPHNCLEPMNFYADVTAKKVHLVGPDAAYVIDRVTTRNVDKIGVKRPIAPYETIQGFNFSRLEQWQKNQLKLVLL